MNRPPLTAGEVSAAATGAAESAGRLSLPDFSKWTDLLAAPAALFEVVRRRLDEGRSPRYGCVFRWPKASGGYRPMTHLDPLDDIVYRVLTGRFVHQIESCLDRTRVLSARIEGRAPAWKMEPYWVAINERTDRALTHLQNDPGGALALLDIKRFFPEIRHEVLAQSLDTLPGPVHSRTLLLQWLRELSDLFNVKGLPIGPEPSAILGNFVLVPLDVDISVITPYNIRYMDDVWCFLPDAGAFRDTYSLFEDTLSELGLKPNDDKCRCLTGLDALEAVRSSLNDYLADDLKGSSEESLDAARTLLDVFLDDTNAGVRELRRALTVLSNRRNHMAVPILQEDASLLSFAPEHWLRYLRALLSDKRSRRNVDVDWVIARATMPFEEDTAAENLIFLHALGATSAPSRAGTQLLELITDSRGWTAPIRVAASCAWNKAEGWKPHRAVEAAEAVSDYGTRRALTLGLDRLPKGSREKHVRRLLRLDNDLLPTVTHLRTAA